MTRGATPVLVADDNRVVRRLVSARLRDAGYRVAEASDGVAALAEFEREPVPVVVTDLNMPRLDGLGLLAALRRREAAARGDRPHRNSRERRRGRGPGPAPWGARLHLEDPRVTRCRRARRRAGGGEVAAARGERPTPGRSPPAQPHRRTHRSRQPPRLRRGPPPGDRARPPAGMRPRARHSRHRPFQARQRHDGASGGGPRARRLRRARALGRTRRRSPLPIRRGGVRPSPLRRGSVRSPRARAPDRRGGGAGAASLGPRSRPS